MRRHKVAHSSRRFLGGMSSIWILLGVSAMGCVPHYKDYGHFVVTPRQTHSQKAYVIEPPDTILIVAPGATEIDGISQRLRPDGAITLHLLGDVIAAGKTPTDLAHEIQEKILDFYEDVQVQVQVTGFNSKFFYMAGETTTGPRSFTGRDTVFSAVMAAGLPRTSWPEKAALLRPNEEGELIHRMSVNLKAMIETGDFKHNAVLEEGDIVWIPINPLAAVGVVTQNLLAPIQPVLNATTTPGQLNDF